MSDSIWNMPLEELLGGWAVELEDEIIDSFLVSESFVEAASEWAREQGWKEPR